ncbi:hypothetical protein FQA39_LY02322 [Lamprigera yunnana]|nr:hypothetical protein FQA39_LY02322 [Lamprigera yunnana]
MIAIQDSPNQEVEKRLEISAETGARVQFQQAKEKDPGERRSYFRLHNVDKARQRIAELIDSVCRKKDGGTVSMIALIIAVGDIITENVCL